MAKRTPLCPGQSNPSPEKDFAVSPSSNRPWVKPYRTALGSGGPEKVFPLTPSVP